MNLTGQVSKVLDDGQWHPFSEFIRLAGEWVSAEKASQVFRYNNRDREIPLEEQIRIGRRRAIMRVIQDLIRNRAIEVKGEEFSREFRKIPKAEVEASRSDVSISVDETATQAPRQAQEAIDYLKEAASIAYTVLKDDDRADFEAGMRSLIRILRSC